jgi:hypothetical protein
MQTGLWVCGLLLWSPHSHPCGMRPTPATTSDSACGLEAPQGSCYMPSFAFAVYINVCGSNVNPSFCSDCQ